jgi:hypothetical protein
MPATRVTDVWSRNALKASAALISTGAALVTLLAHAQSWGWLAGVNVGHRAPPEPEVYWLGLTPISDTLESLGDTLHLAAVATDRHGTLLPGRAATWSTDDEQVASVDSAGTVISAGRGAATVSVKLGNLTARSRIFVLPKVRQVRMLPDSVWQGPEGSKRDLEAFGVDANGNALRDRPVEWRTSDTSVARLDPTGRLTAHAAGSATVTATVDGVTGRLELVVQPVPASMGLLGGAGQRATAGKRLGDPVQIVVLSRGGRPVPGALVRFEVPDGWGSTEPAADSTDAKGRARSRWTLGPQPGRQRLTIRVTGLDSSLVAVAEADPVPANTRLSALADNVDGRVDEALAHRVGILVTDTAGAALPDIPVAWSALDGGTVEAVESRTDSVGEAHARWTLGPKAGSQRARVQLGDVRQIPALMLHANARPAAVAQLAFVSPPKTGTAGRALGTLQILATDAHKNPVPDQALVLSSKQGSVSETRVVTDAHGLAKVTWTLGATAGEQTLSAEAAGGNTQTSLMVKASPVPKSGTSKPATSKPSSPKPSTSKPASPKSK